MKASDFKWHLPVSLGFRRLAPLLMVSVAFCGCSKSNRQSAATLHISFAGGIPGIGRIARPAAAGAANANGAGTVIIRSRLRNVHVIPSLAAPPSILTQSIAVRIRAAFTVVAHQNVPQHPGLREIVLIAFGCTGAPPLTADSTGKLWDFQFRDDGRLMGAGPEAVPSNAHAIRTPHDKVDTIQGPETGGQ